MVGLASSGRKLLQGLVVAPMTISCCNAFDSFHGPLVARGGVCSDFVVPIDLGLSLIVTTGTDLWGKPKVARSFWKRIATRMLCYALIKGSLTWPMAWKFPEASYLLGMLKRVELLGVLGGDEVVLVDLRPQDWVMTCLSKSSLLYRRTSTLDVSLIAFLAAKSNKWCHPSWSPSTCLFIEAIIARLHRFTSRVCKNEPLSTLKTGNKWFHVRANPDHEFYCP